MCWLIWNLSEEVDACGAVYKVELPGSDGKMIAIKVIFKHTQEAT